jgi:hypothetical protein
MTITVDSFKKEYVTSVDFNEGDVIVVSKSNIDQLRQELRKTDLQWLSQDHVITTCCFTENVVIMISYAGCQYADFDDIDETDPEHKHIIESAVHYVFVDY